MDFGLIIYLVALAIVVPLICVMIMKRTRTQANIPTPTATVESDAGYQPEQSYAAAACDDNDLNDIDIIEVKPTEETKKYMEERKLRHLLREHDCVRLIKLKNHLATNIKNFAIVSNIKSAIRRLMNILATPKPKLQVGMLVWGILLAVAGLALLLSGIMSTASAMALFMAMILGGGALITFAFINRSKRIKEWEQMLADTAVKKQQKEEELNVATQQANDYLNNVLTPYIDEISVDLMPAKYASDINAVSAILGLMLDMRAYNVMDAINLYHEIAFRNQILSAADEMVDSARISARAAERSAQANERAAVAAAATAASAASTAASMKRVARASERSASANERIANWN